MAIFYFIISETKQKSKQYFLPTKVKKCGNCEKIHKLNYARKGWGGGKEMLTLSFTHHSMQSSLVGWTIQMDCWTLFHRKVKASSWRDYPIQPQIQKSDPDKWFSNLCLKVSNEKESTASCGVCYTGWQLIQSGSPSWFLLPTSFLTSLTFWMVPFSEAIHWSPFASRPWL